MGSSLKRREARKRKFGAVDVITTTQAIGGDDSSARNDISDVDDVNISLPKKRKKDHLPLIDVPPEQDGQTEEPDARRKSKVASSEHGGEDTITHQVGGQEEEVVEKNSGQRFIVFIGNLPYTATDASIQSHFSKVQPKAIRHRTEKVAATATADPTAPSPNEPPSDPKEKSKGFAFLEFEAYDRMKTCLRLYHHSMFDDGISPGRRLNVELTAGGGGMKSTHRRSKLKAKNLKLNEERKRRADGEKKQHHQGQEQEQSNQDGDGESREGRGRRVRTKERVSVGEGEREKKDGGRGGEAGEGGVAVEAENNDVHPSRRSRVPR